MPRLFRKKQRSAHPVAGLDAQAASAYGISGKRRLALAGVALVVIVGPALAVDEILWRGAHAAAVAEAVSDAILDPSMIFAARSPGARGRGLLLQSKPDRVAPAAYHVPAGEGPVERVLAGVRERPPEPEFLAPPPAGPLVQTLPQFAMSAPPAAPEAGFPGPPGSPFFPGVLPPRSDLTPPGGTPPIDTPPGGPPTAVPEPAAWMLTIMAVFGLGAALRRKRSRRHAPTGVNA